jgi:hypothetical protein
VPVLQSGLNETGKKFNPHMTIVAVTQDDLKKMLDEKFEPLTFSPGGVSIGNFDTGREKYPIRADSRMR